MPISGAIIASYLMLSHVLMIMTPAAPFRTDSALLSVAVLTRVIVVLQGSHDNRHEIVTDV